MLFLLSPAKTLDDQTPVPPALQAQATRPLFVARSAALIEVLRQLGPAEIGQLMSVSEALAQLNAGRFAAWSTRFTEHNSRPAVLAFNGDVYEGLQAGSLSLADHAWAQQHLCILSGLYGLLRPLDRLQPYRLEMGTRLPVGPAKDLYAYWGDTLAEQLNLWQQGEPEPVIVNLASQEYFKAARRKVLRARVVHCHFEEWHKGQWKVISFHAKRARGLMARFAIQQRASHIEQLKEFSAEGYALDLVASVPDELVFRRRSE